MSFDYNSLIIDRTSTDVSIAEAITQKVKNGQTLSPQEKEMFDNGLRGVYNITDLNRVESACEDLMKRLNDYGYYFVIQTKTDWKYNDILTVDELNRIKTNCEKIKQAYTALSTTPTTDTTKTSINYVDANNIEKIIKDIEYLIISLESNFIICGVANCGQGRVWQQRFRNKRTWNSVPFNKLNDFLNWFELKNISFHNYYETDGIYLNDEVNSTIQFINKKYNEIDRITGGING